MSNLNWFEINDISKSLNQRSKTPKSKVVDYHNLEWGQLRLFARDNDLDTTNDYKTKVAILEALDNIYR